MSLLIELDHHSQVRECERKSFVEVKAGLPMQLNLARGAVASPPRIARSSSCGEHELRALTLDQL